MFRGPGELFPIRKAAAAPPTGLGTCAAAGVIHAGIRLRPILSLRNGHKEGNSDRAGQETGQSRNDEQASRKSATKMIEQRHFLAHLHALIRLNSTVASAALKTVGPFLPDPPHLWPRCYW